MLLIFVGLLAVPPASTQAYEVLYAFTGGADGAGSQGLVMDSVGNLYGIAGGAGYQVTVFKLSRKGKLKVLHTFAADGSEGLGTSGAIARDSAGNLYGSTVYGGAFNRGTVFKLDKKNHLSVLLSFPTTWFGAGGGPGGPLTLDSTGNLYGAGGGGTAKCNGGQNCGVVFKLDQSGNETVLRAFQIGKRGTYPNAGLIRDAAGNLYGTTMRGGKGNGVVFKLDPAGNETVLYTFKVEPDGAQPRAGLIQDAAGNFYGTTLWGGIGPCQNRCGVVFKLDTNGNETVLYRFTSGNDGANPIAGLIMDAAGNLYGTAQTGGEPGCRDYVCGTVFKLDPSGKLTVLHTFGPSNQGKGMGPNSSLVMDKAGNLYGTTNEGGNPNCYPVGCGVIFKITP